MLIRKREAKQSIRVNLRVPATVAEKLHDIKSSAADQGYEFDLEGALADFLERAVEKAERELAKSGGRQAALSSAERDVSVGRS